MINCTTESVGRRKQFWSTQQCDAVEVCGRECGIFGIKFSTVLCGDGCDNTSIDGCSTPTSKSISTENWVKGLIINILMTDGARPNSPCGWPAGNRGGHWSSSYRKDSGSSGTNIRAILAGRTTSANVLALQVEAQKIADKLVSYGVVNSAKATVKYLSGMVYSLAFEYVTKGDEIKNVGFSGTRSGNSFVWI